jgi:serine/threonine protein kinase
VAVAQRLAPVQASVPSGAIDTSGELEFNRTSNRPVATKMLAPYLAPVGAARPRFSREARTAAAVGHEHVVPIHDVESDTDGPCLVMQCST